MNTFLRALPVCHKGDLMTPQTLALISSGMQTLNKQTKTKTPKYKYKQLKKKTKSDKDHSLSFLQHLTRLQWLSGF